MKIRVTRAGFIGGHIKKGDTVLCLDNFMNSKHGVDGEEQESGNDF